MATTENTRSAYLANANPRLMSSPNSALIITSSTPVFRVDTAGVPDTQQITFNVISVAIEGGATYNFSCEGGTLSNIAGNTAALNYSAMTADTATVTVSVTYRNNTYTASTKVSKLFDAEGGATGINTALVYAWQRSATPLTSNPGTVTYSWPAQGITTGVLVNGWQKTIPAGDNPLYVTAATASSASSTDTIADNEWSTPVVMAKNGLDGVSPALMSLACTAQTFTYNSTGAETPSSQTITFTANLINTTGTATFICTKYDASGASLGTVTLGGTGNVRTLTVAQFTTSAFRAVVTATLGGLSDTITVVRLADGAAGSGVSAIAGYLTNEAVTVPSGSDGSAPVLTGVTGNFKVFQGTTDVTSGCTFSIVGTPLVVTAAPTASTGAFSVTGAGTWSTASLTTSVTYRATHTASGATIDQVLTITKAPAGVNGASPTILTLTSTAQAFTYNGTGVATPASQTVSFTANIQNITGTATFTCTKYDSAGASLGTVTLGGTGNTRTLTDTQFTTAAFRAVITATLNGLSDTITVVRLADGAAGSGVSALAGYLTNESVNVPTGSDGSNAELTSVNGNFRVFQGTTDVTAGCTFSVVGTPAVVTSAPVNATGYYSVTGVGTWPNNSLTTSVTYRALHTASGATIDQVLTIAKALAGLQGGNGVNSATITVYQRTASTTAPTKPSAACTYAFSPPNLTGLNNGWATTIPQVSGGAYLWATTATAASTTATDSIPASEWATPQMLTQDGGKGEQGTRGTKQVARAIPGSVWSDSEAVLAISGAGGGSPINTDIVTLYNTASGFSQTKFYNGTSWQVLAAYFDGSMIVDGTFILRDKNHNPIVTMGGLQPGFEAPDTKNSTITVNANGTLSGAGGGQVTLPGMGQNSFRVVTNGSSVVAGNMPTGSGFYVNGVKDTTVVFARSYTVVVLNRTTGAVVSKNRYDVYGAGAQVYDGVARSATTMAADLNALTSASIVVVISSDEPMTNRLTGGLDTAMYRCGASRAVYGSPNFKSRAAYVLVGIPGVGEGGGAEAYQGAVTNDPNAWVDIGFNLINGALSGVSTAYTPLSLTDYGYKGDMDATKGAPTGSMVGGTEASLLASRALNGDSAYNALPGINNAIADKLSKTSASILSAPVTLQSAGSIQVGDASNGTTIGVGGIVGTKAGVANYTQTTTGAVTMRELTVLGPNNQVVLTTDKSLAQQAASNPNLAPNCRGFIGYNGATANRNGDERFGDGQYLHLPTSPDNRYVGGNSPALGIPPNAYYTVSFDAFCEGAARYLDVDITNNGDWDSVGMGVTLTTTNTRYKFTEVASASGNSVNGFLRMFTTAPGGSNIIISNIKVELGTKMTPWCDTVIGAHNVRTFIQAGAFGTLSAYAAYLGNLEIGPTGSIRQGSSGYYSGTGLWFGMQGGVPKMHIGTPGVSCMYWNGAKLVIESPEITGIAPFTATISGNLTATVGNGPQNYGTLTVAAGGNFRAPVTVQWSVDFGTANGTPGNAYISSSSGMSASIAGAATNERLYVQVNALLIDADNRSVLVQRAHQATHGNFVLQ